MKTAQSWRVDETSVKVKGVWMDLYCAVDAQGKTVEFHLSPTRDAQAAKRFFAKALGASHTVALRVITVDKNAASPKAFRELKAAGTLAASCELRQSKYLNTRVEQDHRFIKRLVKPGLGFFSFDKANLARVRGDEHDQKRTDPWCGEKGYHVLGRVHRQSLRSGCLS